MERLDLGAATVEESRGGRRRWNDRKRLDLGAATGEESRGGRRRWNDRKRLDLGVATGEESRGGRRQRRGWNETAAGIERMARMSVYLII
jgi:hypothetical protein